jgi:glycosyltransferase involved in cell wall biosynthesis
MSCDMRIVHLSAYGGSYPGSFVAMLRAVNGAALKRGWQFEAVFTPEAVLHPWYAALEDDGVIACIAPMGSRRARSAWVKDLVAEQPQKTVLHSHFTAFDMPVVAVARGRQETLAIWHMHNPPESSLGQVARGVLKFAIAGRVVDGILCVSQETADVVRRRLAPARRVIVFPNAIELRRFLPAATQQERARARAELGIEPGRQVLVHFGWDWERKGGDLFLETVDILAHTGTDVLGLCVGGGEPARTRIADLSLGERAQVLEPRDDVRTLYSAADVFLAPSSSEGMPYAVLEALCTGTPAVISDIPSHVLLAETPGCILAARAPQALAQAVRSTLDARADGGLSVDTSGLVARLDLGDWAERLLDLYAERLRVS